MVLATNAYSGEWVITPQRLSVPMWIIEMETEPIEPERLPALGWSSRSGVTTQHQIMENYRLTARNTIVFGVRRLERGRSYPLPLKAPDPGIVDELASAFATRFPSLDDVAVERAWGGWIAITSSWLSIAGQIDDHIYYSIACNGHGLAQAPYIGSLIADRIVDGPQPDDLEVVWGEQTQVPALRDDGPARFAHRLGRGPLVRPGQRQSAQRPSQYRSGVLIISQQDVLALPAPTVHELSPRDGGTGLPRLRLTS